MAVISLQDVGVIAPRPLFQNITFRFGIGDHVGLIAGNGGGKSTLLRCVAGLAEPDAGVITLSRGARVTYVEQDMPASLLRLTFYEAVRRALSPAGREHESWRVDAVLDGFETPDAVRDQPVAELSGGLQRMVLLARVWVTQPDALLLDEPTNHLDAEKIGFLETWINGVAARTPMLIASHDRRFLDNCTTRSLFLRPDISRIYAHPYTAARRLLAEDDAAQERKHTKDAKEVDRLRRNAGELRNIGVNSGSDLLQKKSMQLRDRATRLEQTLRPAPVDRFAAIRLVNSGTHAKVLVSLKDVTVRAPDGCKLFHVAKFELRQGDRLVLLGANGVGKSQLIAMLRRATNAALPGIHISRSVALGYADQGMAHLPGEQTLRRFISARPGIGDAQATQLLASAGFEVAMHGNAISKLSPGQKARLGMLALRLAEPNFTCWTSRPTTSTFPDRNSWRRSCSPMAPLAFLYRMIGSLSLRWARGFCISKAVRHVKPIAHNIDRWIKPVGWAACSPPAAHKVVGCKQPTLHPCYTSLFSIRKFVSICPRFSTR